MVEQLKEVFNEMQILMLNCCEEEPLGKRPRKEERRKRKKVKPCARYTAVNQQLYI